MWTSTHLGDLVREIELGLHDLLEHGLAVAAVERWQTREHLQKEKETRS